MWYKLNLDDSKEYTQKVKYVQQPIIYFLSILISRDWLPLQVGVAGPQV